MFHSQFASLDEIWGADSKLTPSIVNPFKNPSLQTQMLANAEQSTEPDVKIIRRALAKAYAADGIAGVRPYLDAAIVRDLQTDRKPAPAAPAYLESLSAEDSMFIVIALFALMFALEA